MKSKVALIFGGRSVERDISIITAMQAYHAIDKREYKVEPIYMYEGEFYAENMRGIKDFVLFAPRDHVKLLAYSGGFYRLLKNKLSRYLKPDVALVCCHGGEGEDGTLQAMLEYYGIPHTSPDALRSAICMDKALSKQIFESLGLNVVPHVTVYKNDIESDLRKTIFHIESFLTYPLIVKPSGGGSSIGIEVANNSEELECALNVASEFDCKILVESKLTGFTEVNCAAFRNGEKIVVSETEQPLSMGDILTFNDKYVGGKMSGGGHKIPANIGELNERIRGLTEQIYREMELDGVVRIDYLIDRENTIFVNEINTIPGSLAYYLFESAGITYKRLLDILIQNAMKKSRTKVKSKKPLVANVLGLVSKGGSKSEL